MANQESILFSQPDLSNSLAILKYIDVFKQHFNVVYVSFANSSILDKAALESDIDVIHIPPMQSVHNIEDRAEIYRSIRMIEQEIGIPIEKIFFADMEFYREYRNNELLSLSWLIRVYEQYREIIEDNNIKVHFCFGEDRLHNLLPHYLIKNRGGSSYLLRIVPYYGITFTRDFFGGYTQNENKKLGHIDFEAYKSSVKENKVYFNSDIINKINYEKYTRITSLLRRLYEIELINWQDRSNIYKNHNLMLARTYLSRPINKRFKSTLSNILVYGKLDKSQRYIYYPFHYTDDAQVRLKYPEGYNQYELIRIISRNLPANIKLLVKEHPGYVGNFSLRELRDLSKYPNITVINPKVSSKNIFEYCDYVITINSTVGYEALFFDKVVITMGRSFYDEFPGVIPLKNVTDLYKILSDDDLIKRKHTELIGHLKYRTASLLESSLQFDYHDFYGAENITKIKELLRDHISASPT